MFQETQHLIYPYFLFRIQGGVLAVRQRWRRHDHHQRAGYRHAISGPKPDGGRTARYDQRGGRRRLAMIFRFPPLSLSYVFLSFSIP